MWTLDQVRRAEASFARRRAELHKAASRHWQEEMEHRFHVAEYANHRYEELSSYRKVAAEVGTSHTTIERYVTLYRELPTRETWVARAVDFPTWVQFVQGVWPRKKQANFGVDRFQIQIDRAVMSRMHLVDKDFRKYLRKALSPENIAEFTLWLEKNYAESS